MTAFGHNGTTQGIGMRMTQGLDGLRAGFTLLLTVGALVVAFAAVAAPAFAATSISGTVTDADGHPIVTEDICVVPEADLFGSPGEFSPIGVSVTTAPDGTWSLSSLSPGTYEIHAENCVGSARNDLSTFYDPAETGVPQQITLADGVPVTGVDVALDGATSISGRVFDGPDAITPLQGMCVYADSDDDDGARQALTDISGAFEVRHLDPARTYTISFGPCDISPITLEYRFWMQDYGGDPPTVLSPTVANPLTGVDLHLSPILSIAGGPAAGSVTSATSAVFQFAAWAWPGDVTFKCAIDGAALADCDATYAVTGLTPGEHTLRAQAFIAGSPVHTPVSTITWTVVAPVPTAAPGAITSKVAAPTLRFVQPTQPRLRNLLRSGLPLRLSCTVTCHVSVQASLSAPVARKLKLTKGRKAVRVGATSKRLTSTPQKLVLRLSAKARSALTGLRKPVTLRLRITTTGDGGQSVTTRSVQFVP